jgi:hypothetical protein
MFLSYEQMQADAEAVLQATLAFVGRWPIEMATIEEAVRQSSFSRMQQAEANTRKAPRGDNGGPRDTAGFKAREGKTGGYVRHMTPDDIAYVDEALRSIADPLASLYATPPPPILDSRGPAPSASA